MGAEKDFICIQEMTFNPANKKTKSEVSSYARQYFPDSIIKDYSVSARKETQLYNAVFYRDKFEELRVSASAKRSQRAYKLIDIKWRIYHEILDKISNGGKNIEKQAKKGTLEPFKGYRRGDNKRMFNEVVENYNDSSAYKVIKFRGTNKSLEYHLDDRMAISYLQIKSKHSYKFVVVSLHNISKGGKSVSESYAYLILDFLEKLEMPVVIAGDFNCDITEGAKAAGYHFLEYKLDSRRVSSENSRGKKKGRIDFIAVKGSSSFDFKVTSTYAYKVGDGSAKKEVTNHNPLTATICLRKKKKR